MFGIYGSMWPSDEITQPLDLKINTAILDFKLIEETLFYSVKWALVVFVDGRRFGEAKLYSVKPDDTTDVQLEFIKSHKQALLDKNVDVSFEYRRRGGMLSDIDM